MAALFPPHGDEAQTLRYLDQIDGEAETFKREISKTWMESIRQVRGEQWRLERNPFFLANVIKNQVRRKVALLTESKPQIQIRSQRPNLTRASQVLYQTARSIWDRSNTEDSIYRLSHFGMTVGAGFLGTFYDPIINDIDISFLDPRRVYVDPGVTAAPELSKAQYLRIDTVTPLADLRLRFPGRGALVQPDDRVSSYNESRKTSGVISAVLSMMPRVYRPGVGAKAGPIPRAEVRDYWIRDPRIGDDANLVYPGGRHIVRAGKVILLDEANPYWDGEWPIEMFEWDVDFDSPWGLGEAQDLKRIQEAINRLGDSWVQNRLLGSNFRVVADVDALDPDQWQKLDDEAGLIIRKKPNRAFEYQPPVPDDGTMPQTIQSLIQLCDLLTGNIAERSRQPQATDMEGLQFSRQTLVRSVARRLETMLERIGQKLISRIFQFYTSDRVLFQLGASREWIAYTFERQRLLEDDDGKARSTDERQAMWRDFKFMIVPHSSLAMTRIQRVMAALQLRSATGVAPSIKRILQEADMGDPDTLIEEGLEEASRLPPPPVPKGKGGRQ